ncbi:NADH-quinone oxidoreductase subunit NuoG [Yersinia pseudotuberculosis]|uniref:NADH-quinone oxidoreductase n=2 Tax=Yersinia pseudotuberculosis TaxID=633 RepID=A0ABM7AJX2_YERPU|nr:NADH-quinone oxidoreductase subunit NuoG [Yersinia pseudotuberculosis]AIN14765.1 NADH dehydrogenase (quinone), G subunit [Yersinia pseudotuberculosis]AJJ06399.1 NADH dehydrogenase (quinone), G subunit [Yersinia pseudotuberculosis]AJJ58101.1 NADH dehydrogenase (quinone), G subunit [Yersinia pseudotuberculosis YPIII]AYW87568.1 NADH-quinone oxidoreductase subunit NuoG [Yersinia pseudotuberculosis]AYW92648.1 NADH-quinone oxidoreductase subunit NuoG [Yersinia pseudotuberculosis]
MATIHVDGKEYDVNGADNLLQACLSLGLDIPYFCWHPALGSVGACRQCAVKQYQNADDTRGRLVMSCMTPATDGTFISIDDSEAKAFRESVVEWLMTNHPHDCPVCEEGGNCHLQDMTVMTGHSFRRYRFTKRTHQNQDLGPFISHEMNRCIACYRCVRYYKDYADGTDLGVYGAHDNVYFGRTESGTLESEFSGNLVEVCPTGVFTDKTHSERYNRKWDMQFAPSICQQCSVGCNTSPGERYGELRRIENRYNGSVNHYFMCDRGRFGYGYVNLKDRPRQPQQLRGSDWIHLNADQAMQGAADILRQAKKTIGIGSPRASLESNFALRELVGAENFYTGIAAGEQQRLQLMLKVLREGGIYTPALREIESYDAVLILGEDLTQTGARIALSVRQAVKGKAREMAAAQKVADWQIAAIMNIGQHAKHPLFITNVDNTRMDDIAAWNYRAPVDDQARLGFAIAHALDESAPAVADLDRSLKGKVDIIVQALAGAKKPLIITGSSAGSDAIIEAAANVAKALKNRGSDVGITFVASAANSIGLSMIGGGSLDQALELLTRGEADSAIVMENDLYRHAAKDKVDAALDNVANLIVVDHQRTAIMDKANLILSAASFAESDGTLVNQEGRAQRFFQVYDPTYYDDPKKPESRSIMLESWRWLHSLHSTYTSRHVDWTQLDHVIAACVEALPQLQGIVEAAPDATFRIRGQRLARSPHRYSGRTAMRANISVHEPRQPQDIDTPFSFSMEGNNSPLADRQQIPFAWAPGWNSPQAWNKFQAEVGGSLRFGDPGVRLIEAGEGTLDYFDSIPAAFTATAGNWQIAPYYHLFGSEEMSQRSDVIQQRMPTPYVMVNPADAAALGVNLGTLVEFNCAGQTLRLPVRLSDTLAPGQVGLPLGLPGIPPILVGARVEDLREAVQ